MTRDVPQPNLAAQTPPVPLARRLVAAVTALLVALAPGLVDAQPFADPPESLEGRTIASVEVEGLQNLSEDTLVYYLDLRVGEPLRLEALNSRIKNLWQRQLIDDLEVGAEPVDDGVAVTVRVVERPVLRSVDYEGNKKVSRNEIRDRMVEERIDVREGGPLSYGELARLQSAIAQLYSDKGYRFAEVDYRTEDVGPGERRVVFSIDEGDRVRIADIDFEGNTVFSDPRLRLTMRKTKESGPITRLLRKDIYNPGKLEEDLEKLRSLYRDRGYKNVLIGEPEVAVREVGSKRRMLLTIPIEEGERYRFGEISIDGNEQYSDQALLRVFRNRPGSWLKADLIDEGIDSIRKLYENTGYMFVRVEPELVERGDNVADVRIRVNEGDQFRVGRIDFEGNERTMDKVLRRELRVQEGYLMNLAALRNSVYKVNQLGYFKLDEDEPVDVEVRPEEKMVDLTFQGQEADRTELQFGGGWSEFEGFFGQFAVRTQNFLGRGESVQASFQSGKRQDFFDLGYFVPWFLDRPQTVGLQVFSRSLNYDFLGSTEEYVQDSEGGTLTYGRSLGLFQSMSVAYTRARYTEEGTFNFDDEEGGSTQTVVNDVIDSSSLRPLWAFNSIDNRLEPTRGQRMTLSTEYSGGALGGENNFFKPEVGYTLYKPLNDFPVRHLVGLNVEGGYIEPFGEGVESVFEFYRLGGERSIRGFRRLSIFPVNENGLPFRDPAGFIIGGDKYLQVNLEYHFLAGGPFRVVAFTDAGNTWEEGRSIGFSDLYWTAGIELRILVPVFGAPLRFIYATNLGVEPISEGDLEEFQFSIGATF